MFSIIFFLLLVFDDLRLLSQEVAATKRANKLDRVRKDLLALPQMSRIKLRVSAGVFEVSLFKVHDERNTVEVVWDDGLLREFKWSSVVWGKVTEDQMVGQKPTEVNPNPESACQIPCSSAIH